MFLNQAIYHCKNPKLDLLFKNSNKKRKASFKNSLIEEIESYDLIIFLGIDQSVYEGLNSWIKQGKTLIFLENDQEVFFSTSNKLNEGSDGRVQCFFIDQDLDETLKNIVWNFSFQKKKILCHPEFIESDLFQKVRERAGYLEDGKHLAFSDVADFGKRVFQNIYENISVNSAALKGSNLKGAFERIPAVICGAGPSFEKEIGKIEEIKNRALIFSGGSSINLLSKEGIIPHFAAAVDKNAPFEKFKEHTGFLTPFFFQMRTSSENLSLIHETPICFGESKQALFQTFIEECFSIPSFSSGWCVGNFLTNVALYLGCDPIILVGMDFSYPKGQKYADSNESKEKIVVQRDFAMAKKWTCELSVKYPQTLFINASKKYEGKSKIVHLEFTEAIFHLLHKENDLEGLVHQRLQTCKKLSVNQGTKIFAKLSKSFRLCGLFCQEALEKEGIADEKLENEIAYQYIILPIWRIFAPLIDSKLREQNIYVDSVLKKKVQKILLFQKIIELYITMVDRF